MGFFKNLFKAEREHEENLRKQTIENQVKTWEIQARMGQTPNVQADMEKIYGLDKLEQKQREKQQTKEIIKGAVVGGIVAGDAGAVVGAMAAKNKIDSRNANNVPRSTVPTYTPPAPVVPQAPRNNYVESRESTYLIQDANMPPAIKFYSVAAWTIRFNKVKNDPNANTGNLRRDVEYCLRELGVATLKDISRILDSTSSRVRPEITPLIDANLVERVEYNGRLYFIWKQGEFGNSCSINDDTVLNFYGSSKWNTIKASLINNSNAKTGNPQKDVLYCLNQLAVAKCSDLSEILEEDVIRVRPMLTPLMNNDVVKRVEHQGAVVFFITDKSIQNKVINSSIAPVQANNKFDEVRKFKELLDSGIITQEEFNTKKKELLGL